MFCETITDLPSWGKIFQSIDLFYPLIRTIFEKEHLSGWEPIANLTPGTNAVFRAGRYVVKIFVPITPQLDFSKDFLAELESMKTVKRLGIASPQVLCWGEIEDRYVFRYIVMEYVDAVDAGQVLPSFDTGDKLRFVEDLRDIVQRLNVAAEREADWLGLQKEAISNFRWQPYPKPIQAEIFEYIAKQNPPTSVYVHGDLTAENILIDRQKKIYVIDFADSKIAMPEYEYPPIFFDLFAFDLDMTQHWIRGFELDAFVEALLSGTVNHDFGGDILAIVYKRLAGKELTAMENLDEIRRLLYQYYAR